VINNQYQLEDKDKFQGFNDADEFEEFPIQSGDLTASAATAEEPAELKVWEDHWEDETVEKDFSIQLSEELGNKDILKYNI